jgi:hypothetical protein
MFSRSKQLDAVDKPVIDQIAECLMKSGYKALISDNRSYVQSATSGYNFRVVHDEERNWIQFRVGISNEGKKYKHYDANNFNEYFRCVKVTLDDDSDIWLNLDLIYIPDQDITGILSEYIRVWDILVGHFHRSLCEVRARHDAEQEALKTSLN